MSKKAFWKIKRECRRLAYQISHPHLLRPYLLRKLLFRQFDYLVNNQPNLVHFTPLQKISLLFFGSSSKGLRQVELKGRSCISSKLLVLAQPSTYRCEEPRCVKRTSKSSSGEFRSLQAYVGKQVVFSPVSSTVLSQTKAYVPDYYINNTRAVVNDGHFLLWQSADGMGLLDYSPPEDLNRGICLFGSGVENWYHWLIEILPAAYFAQRLPSIYDDYPFLVPRRILKIPQFSEALELLRGDREILPLDKKLFRVEKLVMIDQIVREPINMRVNHWPQAEDYAYNPDLMLDYRQALMDSLGISFNAPSKKLFLARGHSRRAYNQEELLAIAQRHGFEAFYPEKHSFREQVETFAQAKCIIGPSGAAFANSIFCQKDTRLLSWLVSNYSGFCSYSNVATTVGTHLRYMFVNADTEIKSTFDAYNATYHVDEVQFEKTIETMLTSPDW